MWRSTREDRPPPRRYAAARVERHCPATPAHGRSLRLAHATIAADGWAHWVEDGHVVIGDLQAGPCGDPPAVSTL